MFIISLTYIKPNEEIAVLLEDHVEYLKEQYFLGNFLVSGRKVALNGEIILARAVTRDEIVTIMTLDPFYRHEIASYEITEFNPTMTADTLVFLKE